jgi:hypothetical protein
MSLVSVVRNAVFASALSFAIVVCHMSAVRADGASLQFTTCATFTGPTWVNPMPPYGAANPYQGNKYELSLTSVVVITAGKKKVYPPMTCAGAELWVKKLALQHIAGKPMLPQYPPLKNGPPRFVCQGTPDLKGHAYRGNCAEMNSPPGGGVMKPSFVWST